MGEYITLAKLDVNGQSITDFKSVTENERDVAKQVNLMNKTGHAKVTTRHSLSVEYVVPTTGEFDWDSVEDGRLTLEYEGGKRVTYTGVYTLKIGEAKADGENEMVRPIDLGAEDRTEE